MTAAIERVLAELEREGVLLASDAVLPSVASLVAGRAVRGSWWADASGRAIFSVLTALEEQHGVASVKLVNGKVTLLHERLEPALLAIATSDERWQHDRLSRIASRLLERVLADGSARLDRLVEERLGSRPALSKAATQLEQRLLVASASEHTEHGAHERVLASWRQWARARGRKASRAPIEECKQAFESVVDAWREGLGVRAVLPWHEPRRHRAPSRARR